MITKDNFKVLPYVNTVDELCLLYCMYMSQNLSDILSYIERFNICKEFINDEEINHYIYINGCIYVIYLEDK